MIVTIPLWALMLMLCLAGWLAIAVARWIRSEPAPPDPDPFPPGDPLNPEPKVFQPILFADGLKVQPVDLSKAGLSFTVDGTGRIIHVLKQGKRKTVEEFYGDEHGARIS